MPVAARHAPLLIAFFMSLCMALPMSGVLTLLNLGFNTTALLRWPRNFIVAWPIAFPTVLLVGPQVRRLVAWLTRGG